VADALVEELLTEGQSAERRGNRAEARGFYERALERLDSKATAPRAATVLRWIARTHMLDANADAALSSARAAFALSQSVGDDAGAGQAINVEGTVHWQRGNLDEAERLFLEARRTALSVSDAKLAAITSQNLGVIATIRGDLSEAVRYYSIALEHSRGLGLVGDICASLNNLGKVQTELANWDDAERAYLEAAEMSGVIGDLPVRIAVTLNIAEMWLARDDVPRAGAAVAEALALSARTGDSGAAAQILKLRGILARRTGNPLQADEHFASAIALAEARHDPLLLAETLRERADLDREQGRNRESLQNLNRAHRLFGELKARRELANVDRSMGRLEGDFVQIARHWGESIEAKDRYTQGHCMRVADLSCELAVRAGIDEQALFWFRIGALLHDVGKLVIPSEVLNKTGKLTDEEWALMKRHPTAGMEILAEIDFPWDVRPIIESHHERWDGRGYPHGLAGLDIPLSARIVALADVYDALTSERSYKRGLTHEETMEIMRKDIGKAFDPELFSVFEQVVFEERFRRDSVSQATAA
jgi:putative nucleotidyltransferase with HDIG domain